MMVPPDVISVACDVLSGAPAPLSALTTSPDVDAVRHALRSRRIGNVTPVRVSLPLHRPVAWSDGDNDQVKEASADIL